MKVTIWNITGYKGRDDYDGPQDDNVNIEVSMDSRFSRQDVEEIMCNYWGRKYRTVAIHAMKIGTMNLQEEH